MKCGEALVNALKAVAREQKAARLALDVWSFNINAQNFFNRQGFRPFNERLWMEMSSEP